MKCWLRNISNYFNKTTPLWRGKYECKKDGCNVTFQFWIEKNDKKFIEVFYRKFGIASHSEAILKTIAIKGEKREEMANVILAKGITSAYNQTVLSREENFSEGKINHHHLFSLFRLFSLMVIVILTIIFFILFSFDRLTWSL